CVLFLLTFLTLFLLAFFCFLSVFFLLVVKPLTLSYFTQACSVILPPKSIVTCILTQPLFLKALPAKTKSKLDLSAETFSFLPLTPLILRDFTILFTFCPLPIGLFLPSTWIVILVTCF